MQPCGNMCSRRCTSRSAFFLPFASLAGAASPVALPGDWGFSTGGLVFASLSGLPACALPPLPLPLPLPLPFAAAAASRSTTALACYAHLGLLPNMAGPQQ